MSDLIPMIENILGMPPRRPEPEPERTDHVGWARGFLNDAERPFDPDEPGADRDATVAENLAFAQVHATLAIAEQQKRIADLMEQDRMEQDRLEDIREALR